MKLLDLIRLRIVNTHPVRPDIITSLRNLGFFCHDFFCITSLIIHTKSVFTYYIYSFQKHYIDCGHFIAMLFYKCSYFIIALRINFYVI